MLATLLALIAAASYLLSAWRLLCFQRSGSRVRHGISLLAALLIAGLICAALEIVLYHPLVSLWQAVNGVLLYGLILRSRGNLAALLRWRS